MSPQLRSKFDLPGPRYASCPTADRFVEAFTTLEYVQSVTQRVDMHQRMVAPLSMYVHVLFCESVGYIRFCNNLQVTPDGWFFVRAVALVFDKYLQADRSRAQFSGIL